jgi:hypothetical protein
VLDDNNIIAAIDHFLGHLPYYRCLLLVHKDVARLNATGRKLAAHYHWPTLRVGQDLSRELLDIAPNRRPLMVQRKFPQLVREYTPGPLICSDIDLLFEPTLQIDPLRLLRETARLTTLIVLWPGSYSHDTLSYAVPEHNHFQNWSQPELCDYCLIAI